MSRNVTEVLRAKINTEIQETGSNGQIVYVSANEFGELIDAAYNRGLSANDVNVINQEPFANSGVFRLFQTASSDVVSSTYDVSDYTYHRWDFYVSGSATSNVDVSVESSMTTNTDDWISEFTQSVSNSSLNFSYKDSNKMKYFRVSATGIVNSEVSSYYLGGN